MTINLIKLNCIYSNGGTGSSYRNGTCYTSSECTDAGGRAQGNCAAG